METIRLTTSQALVKFLNQQYIEIDGIETPYVEGVFNIFGHGNVVGIGQALQESPGHLKVYQGKNEQGMAHAAMAYSKQLNRRKIFAVTASAGPGSANMVTAAATAFANNIPMLLLPADTFATRQPDPVLQQLEHETSYAITTNDAFPAVSRYFDRIQRPEQLMSSLLRAFEVMTNPATAGPATLCISQDTEGEAYDYDVNFFQKRVHYINRQVPTTREIEGAIQRIQQSQRPVIIVGGGARYSEAAEILKALSLKHNIPLVETQAGKSTVTSAFENNLGGTGILGTSAANQVISETDLIIGVGTRYTDFTTSSKTAFDEKTAFLNININRMQTYKLEAFQVVADARAGLEAIANGLGDYTTTYGEDFRNYKAKWNVERERLANVKFNREAFTPEIKNQFDQTIMNEYADVLKTEFTQTAALITANETVKPDSIVIGSAGSLPGDLQRLWNTTVPHTYNLEYGYSCMGYEVAGALGAKLAAPEQEVYAALGDGSFLMLHTELVTALQYNKKINLLLFDNAGYGCINNLQMEHGSDSYHCELRDNNNTIMNINYAKVAEGYGAKGYTVSTKEELVAAIKDAEKQTVSTVIEIKVLPKTMSDGYDAWWHVGVSEVSDKASVLAANTTKEEKLQQAKKY
ncbi:MULTISPECIES: 3D-(3,5/4)-trihydroxycyclohexane-1,2-dione acylhydrolase (decyclizing) [Brochothrix]|uniref:3D-(3,5/4)-trihydroxycyclohexane-1,2-dione acylhydrolase (Decyclizing) n=1 Tax=Brochothrix thermosphacta TaxID=2756 RepID=A0A1D2LCV4_BROTH|nr:MULTISPECIES: 3D-(3,5/4)-trihydroxycyclohexane-1,2-dione acylhydrolase (decyclizing) [Brochothrix]SLN04642.1 Epi-inositol hydrolase [Brachybacterium faecium]ANZ94250.1 3D-(3,5/4)-trihydroxycyclohexane-1,2-dione acylhydrolase (decyclizing) [Brochothrix thermosphacta]ATF26894.1 3D-(3,5/4)-trihydroxycyclohexane-1,2-dione acylhydrolase (decyclizing) [Brochothrix thermosphacta]ATH86251.1 3D-(3,5/4)-trihydroxycyclohexane-1,2-dione acylhydrolase (decyclizing) [Brochothrix thermosphacta]EUJ35068.1 